jgi:MYXO-CTERM domain-containing protein
LPTGDPGQGAGPLNQYLSIWNAVGGTLAGLQNQFDGVQTSYYWSGTENALSLSSAWVLLTADGGQYFVGKDYPAYTVAVRPGDVAAVVPEPQALALGLVGLGVLAVMRRRRPR